jgi:hypothetical protein
MNPKYGFIGDGGIQIINRGHHCLHKQNTHYAPVTCYECNEKDYERIYLGMKECYYSGTPCYNDKFFDFFEDRCRKLFPENSIFYKVGS